MLGSFINNTFLRHINEAKISYSKSIFDSSQLNSDQNIIRILYKIICDEDSVRNKFHKSLLFNEILSISEKLYNTVCIRGMKIPIKQALYLIISCRYYLRGNHLSFLNFLMKNGEKNIKYVKRVISYPEFRDWITMRDYIDNYYNNIKQKSSTQDFRDDEFRMIFELEIKRINEQFLFKPHS